MSACGSPVQKILDAAEERRDPRGATDQTPSPRSVNARELGAKGDGKTDDTHAINAAIRAAGNLGRSVTIPDGIYLINPAVSVQVATNVPLLLGANATLQAIPVRAGFSAVIACAGLNNVRISGGKIVGERTGHLGTTGEWGMGIRVLGCSDVRLEGIQVVDCWGDGFYIGALAGKESQNVTISKCSARNNRRQGLSITGCVGADIVDCELTDTVGTAPAAGIDLEPNRGLRVSEVTITNCITARNSGHGILLVGDGVSDVRITSGHSYDNWGSGVAMVNGATGCSMTRNLFEGNRENGVLLSNAHRSELWSNVVRHNGHGRRQRFTNIMVTGGSSHDALSDNHCAGVQSLAQLQLPDITVTPDCRDIQIGTSQRRSRGS